MTSRDLTVNLLIAHDINALSTHLLTIGHDPGNIENIIDRGKVKTKKWCKDNRCHP